MFGEDPSEFLWHSCHIWKYSMFAVLLFSNISNINKAQFGYPHICRAFLECWCSFCLPSALVGSLSARWCRVLMTVHLAVVLFESLHLLSFYLDPGVVHLSEPVAWCCSLAWAQCFALHSLHIKVSHGGGHWGSRGTAVLLSYVCHHQRRLQSDGKHLVAAYACFWMERGSQSTWRELTHAWGEQSKSTQKGPSQDSK